MLAIPACPDGEPHLLGSWAVWDTAGTFCLGPSSSGNKLAAVNCDPTPLELADPVVYGFSSTGAPPCSTGSAGCTLSIPESATFHETTSLDGSFPYPDPWSPAGQLLALNTPSGLVVLDAAHPSERPRRIFDQQVGEIAWSPDGTWIAFQVKTITRDTGDIPIRRALLAAPADGTGSPAVVVDHKDDLGHFVWASDGNLYIWTRRDGMRSRTEPPSGWRQERIVPRTLRAIPIREGASRNQWVRVFDADLPALERPIPHTRVPDGCRVIPHAIFPSGAVLATAWGGGIRASTTIVLAPTGEIVESFDPISPTGGFYGTSVSANGRFVLGQSQVEDSSGHSIVSSELLIADPSARWTLPISGTPPLAEGPMCAHAGTLIAFGSQATGRIHVGELEVRYE